MLSKRKKVPRPYKVTEAFNLTRSGRNPLRFDHGSKGAAWDYDEQSKSYLVSIPAPDFGETDKVVWVPAKKIQVNPNVEVGKISVEFGRLDTTVKQFNERLHGGRLFRVMVEFFEGLRQAPGMIAYMQSSLITISSEKLQTICQRVVEGFQLAGLDQLLERDDFTLSDITSVARRVPTTSYSTTRRNKNPTKGVYLIEHTSTSKQIRAIYVGKSVNIEYRADQHVRASTSKNAPHYQTWRKTDTHKMYVLCKFNLNDADLAETLPFAETFLVTIGLQTYPTWLLKTTPEAVQEGNEFDIDLTGPTDDDDAAAIPYMDTLHAVLPQIPGVVKAQPNTKVRHTMYRETALKVLAVAKIIAERTHWPGGTTRENFGCEQGLNIATPLSLNDAPDSVAPTVWQQMEIPKVMTLYMRSAQNVVKFEGEARGIRITYHSQAHEIACRIAESAPKPGTKVYVMIEVMHSGPHPHEFARLPDLAEANDWALARALGIAYLWGDESGNWHKRYVQSSLYGQYNEKVPCKSYCEAISLVRALRQEVIRDHPEWIGFFRPFPIHRINTDWLSQCYHVSTAMNISQVPMPMEISRAARINLLTSAGAENIGKPFPYLTDFWERARKKCDACYLAGKSQTCEQVPGTQSCFYCNKLRGIACSWTPRDRMPTKLIALLDTKAKKDASILTIDAPHPKFVQITTSGVAGLSLS